MCSRLMAPHSGAERGYQLSSRGGGVRGGDSLSSRLGDAGSRRTHVSFRLTQFLHGFPSSHCESRRQSVRRCSQPCLLVSTRPPFRSGTHTYLDLAFLAPYTPQP
jgi:hypothetical protein